MAWRRLTDKVERAIRDVTWWVTVGPFCTGNNLAALGAPTNRPLHLGGQADQYPVTELLGRLWAFRNRVRFARSLLILPRGLVLCAVILLLAKVLQVISLHPMSSWLPVVLFVVLGWAFHLAMHHEIPSFEVARLVDRRAGLHAQLATAVEYTLARRLDEPLVKTQIRVATGRIRELEPSEVVPLVWPSRDLQLLAVVAILYGAITVAGSMGLTVPRPRQAIDAELARLASQDPQAPTSFVTMDPSQVQFPTTVSTSDQLVPQLKVLQQELASQSITPEQYQAQLADLQKQLQDQASQSIAAQQALNALAAALKDSSATHSISDSLARGEYQQASSQLNDLSRQLDQLSPEARSELASRLGQAAAQTRSLDSAISQSAQQASDALKQNDNAQASQSLQSLSSAVQQASSKIATQAQLGQALQEVQRGLANQQQDTGSQQAGQAQSSNDTLSQASSTQSLDQASASGDAQSSLDREAASSDGSGSPDSATSPGSGQPSSSQQIQQGQSSNSGGAGAGPGSNLLDSKPTPLDVSGVKLTITGQASGDGNDQTQAGDRSTPLTGADGSSISGGSSGVTSSSNVPINVHQESNVVPLEMKPVVREYFSNGGS